MRRILLILATVLTAVCASAQVDRREVREGNRKFRGGNFRQAEIDYRKAALKDSLSVAAQYNLASSLYRQEDYAGAAKALETIKDVAPSHPNSADYFYNAGDVALQAENYQAAVEAFKQALLRNPGDLDAKENYIYAKKKLQDQQQDGGGQDNQDNQDQDQNQDQNQDQQQQQQDQDQNQDQQQQQQPREQKISPQQAQQMLNAIQAKEKETQDKVNKEKAQANPNKKEKNW